MAALNQAFVQFSQQPTREAALRLLRVIADAKDERALQRFGQVLPRELAQDCEVLLGLGVVHAALGKNGEAQSCYVQASRAAPTDARPFAGLGELLLQKGDLERSQKALERAIQLGDASDNTRRLLAQAKAMATSKAGLEAPPPRSEERPQAYEPTLLAPAPPVPERRVAPPRSAARPPPSTRSGAERLLALANAQGHVTAEVAVSPWVVVRTKVSGWRSLLAGTFVLASCLLATYAYGRSVLERRAAYATERARIAAMVVRSGDPMALAGLDAELLHASRLSPTDARVAELRVIALVQRAALGERPTGWTEALRHAQALGVRGSLLSCGRAASQLVDGDRVGATLLLLRAEAQGQREPCLELLMGSVLEHVGSEQAQVRYENAARLAPDQVTPRIVAARALLIEGQREQAAPHLRMLSEVAPNHGATRLLLALARGAGKAEPAMGDIPGPDEVPPLLRPLSSLLEAEAHRAAQDRKALAESLWRGIARGDSPAFLARMGSMALLTKDEALVQRLAAAARSASSVHAGARAFVVGAALRRGDMLGAEALAGGRSGESADAKLVALVRAYEALDTASLLDGLRRTEHDATATNLAALATGVEVVLGRGYPTREQLVVLEASSLPWARTVAIDAALDTDHLDLVERWFSGLDGQQLSAALRIRRARWLRYQGQLPEAIAELTRAKLSGASGPRVFLELLQTKCALGDFAGARAVLADASAVDRALAPWLEAYLEASANYRPRARKLLQRARPVPASAPLAFRVLGAAALVRAGDPRGKPVIKELAEHAARHPDVLTTLTAL